MNEYECCVLIAIKSWYIFLLIFFNILVTFYAITWNNSSLDIKFIECILKKDCVEPKVERNEK